MYLGLGVLLLAVLLIATAFFKPPAVRSGARVLVPAAICCTFLLLLSLSTRITLGSLVFDLDPRQYLTKYLSVFRASGRLAWTPYYFIVIGVLTGVVRSWPRWLALALLSMALLLQIVDTAGVRTGTRNYLMMPVSNPLKSGVWSQLHRFHHNLIVVPPFPCGDDMPGGGDSWRVFGLLAADQGMRTNGYYAARTSLANLKFQCEELPQSFRATPLAPIRPTLSIRRLRWKLPMDRLGPAIATEWTDSYYVRPGRISGCQPWCLTFLFFRRRDQLISVETLLRESTWMSVGMAPKTGVFGLKVRENCNFGLPVGKWPNLIPCGSTWPPLLDHTRSITGSYPGAGKPRDRSAAAFLPGLRILM